MRHPFLRLAVQNLARRPGRTLALAAAVAVAVGAGFAALVARQAVADNAAAGLDRMGADLLVVPADALVNLTPALLAVEPGPHALPPGVLAEIARVPGVVVAAPQRSATAATTTAGHAHDQDVIAFDPGRDFTVMPWVREKLDRPLAPGDVLIGARRPEAVGGDVTVGGKTVTVYGRLGPTGVGPVDRSFFVSFDTASVIIGSPLDSNRPTGVLLKLAPSARPEQVKFALSGVPGIKVVAGPTVVTNVRRTLELVLGGVVLLTGVMLAAGAVQIGVVYSAVLAERRQELGLLRTIGVRPGQVARMVLVEAAVTTGLGGAVGVVLGIGLLFVLRRTLGFELEMSDTSYVLPPIGWIAAVGISCLAVAAAIGPLGAAGPAWKVCRQDPYDLARGGTG